jgi:hypothetical protein
MLLKQEQAYEPRLWFAWRPVWAASASGRRGGWVWLEQVVAYHIEGTWGGGGGGWHYRRVPMPSYCDNAGCEHVPDGWQVTIEMENGFAARGVGRVLEAGVRRAVDERIEREDHHHV